MRPFLLVALLALVACGIKAPPKPPLDVVTESDEAPQGKPDAGCCGAAR